ncbi:protein phosphatase CheZ [Paraburkholderia sp.]|uniref:protein phosphatase CheZ n=1 Tax=Paraburkholderia sp. TaxID=1926495 RepID=UPI0039E4B6FB
MNDLSNILENATPADDAGDVSDVSSDRILARIGQLTRTLRDSMRELGLDQQLQAVAQMVPDAHDRLKYVVTMTEQAAERALNAIELAQPLQEKMHTDARLLDDRWAHWYEVPLARDDASALIADTRSFLKQVPQSAEATNARAHSGTTTLRSANSPMATTVPTADGCNGSR